MQLQNTHVHRFLQILYFPITVNSNTFDIREVNHQLESIRTQIVLQGINNVFIYIFDSHGETLDRSYIISVSSIFMNHMAIAIFL